MLELQSLAKLKLDELILKYQVQAAAKGYIDLIVKNNKYLLDFFNAVTQLNS